MPISLHLLKKWSDMVRGKSVYHVNQGPGRIYSKDSIAGYYNDLTEKVTLFGREDDEVPTTVFDTGESIFFSIAIFQYGLASYDLFLLSEKKAREKLNIVLNCANWAVENQEKDGSWVTFAFENTDYPFSAMAQGEGVSLLLRAYQETNQRKYLETAKLAMNFMLLSFEDGGTTKYEDSDIFLYECPKDPLILNGWIFSLWGLMDYCKYFNDVAVNEVLHKSLKSLEKYLHKFDLPFWSRYEFGKRISSPFYHKLHIAQLNVMYDLTGVAIYKNYADKWQKYQENWFYRKLAFVIKAFQKVFE